MWSFCKDCKSVTPVMPMSPEVECCCGDCCVYLWQSLFPPLQTWHVSFAKYLELTLFAPDYIVGGSLCPHSYHHRHVRYFGKVSIQYIFFGWGGGRLHCGYQIISPRSKTSPFLFNFNPLSCWRLHYHRGSLMCRPWGRCHRNGTNTLRILKVILLLYTR